MERRTFAQMAALAPALAAPQNGRAEVALITHADGPHLSAYIEGLAKCAEVETVRLCDASGATEAAVRKGLGSRLASAHRSPAELFGAHKPGLALITMEGALAPPVINASLDAGCHVMAEKPACVRATDFAPLAAKAAARRRNLMLAMANRVDPVMVEARRIVQSGAIGRMYGLEMHTIADQTRLTRPAYHGNWTAKKSRSGGGHLIWLGIHWLDLAMYITGSRIEQVAGFTGNVGGQPIDTEDSAVVSFRFANGTLGNITSGYYLDKAKQLFIKVWGSEGWVEVNHHDRANPLQWYSTKSGKPESGRFRPNGTGGYTPWVIHAVRASLGVEPPVLSPDESLYVLETVFASYRAAETGRTMRVRS
jgi:predicted dehydrogenase